MRCVVGVDLGGTNVRAAAIFEDGSPAGPRIDKPSRAQQGTAAILDAISSTILEAIGASTQAPEAIGMAIPGHIDNPAGVVRWAPNFGETVDGIFYHWENIPMREPLSRHISIPIVMANDANAAALGEYRFGTGRNQANCLVMLTVGTGIGGGVVLGPQSVQGGGKNPLLLVGGNKGGAELGHCIVSHQGLDCHAGSYGSLEAYCQRDSIVQRAVHRLKRHRPSLLNELCDNDLSALTPLMLTEAAHQGDELALEVWNEVGTFLGVGIGTYINVFAPDIFAIGGQIAKAGDLLLEPARKAARNVAIPSLFADTTICQAERIDDAGMIGGAAVAFGGLN